MKGGGNFKQMADFFFLSLERQMRQKQLLAEAFCKKATLLKFGEAVMTSKKHFCVQFLQSEKKK